MPRPTANADNTCAVILAGGKNLRMQGRHKIFLKLGNTSLFNLIHQAVSPQVKQILLNVNDDLPELADISVPIIKDLPKAPFEGPLAGVVSSLKWLHEQQANAEWLLSIPGDTPFLPSDLLSQLSEAAALSGCLACFSSYNNRKHFLTALWHKSVLSSLIDYLNSENRSVKGAMHRINGRAVDIKIPKNTAEHIQQLLFFNINTQQELDEAFQRYTTQENNAGDNK